MEPWIKVERKTRFKPEVRKIAKALGITKVHALGACTAFWLYADAEMRNGFIRQIDRDDIDDEVETPGFAAAMESAEWIYFADGGVYITNPDVHLSNIGKKKAQDSKRVDEFRRRQAESKAEPEGESDGNAGALQDETAKRTRIEETRLDTPPPTPSKPRRSPKREAKSARRKRATEEAEAVKALGPAWEPAIAAVRRIGPAEANSAILTASELEHPPDRVLRFVAVLERNLSRFENPPGALVARLCNADPDPLKGWLVEVADDRPTLVRPPDPEREREDLIASIMARDKCSPGEASKRADAELAMRNAGGRDVA